MAFNADLNYKGVLQKKIKTLPSYRKQNRRFLHQLSSWSLNHCKTDARIPSAAETPDSIAERSRNQPNKLKTTIDSSVRTVNQHAKKTQTRMLDYLRCGDLSSVLIRHSSRICRPRC